MKPDYTFPKDFIWGAASAAYQVEGGHAADGRGASIWDTYCRIPGNIPNGATGDRACESYFNLERDIGLLRDLGVHAYRFSIAWPRVVPAGRGKINAKGLDYYERLVDLLLKAGIKPFATLYHWDLPQALEDDGGGWESRNTALAFGDYTRAVSQRLGDRVKHWMTFNEIPTGIAKGYRDGNMAPGKKLTGKPLSQVFHHVLVAHGLAIDALKADFADTQVGLAHDPFSYVPVVETAEHIQAAALAFAANNDWLLEPLFNGRYPDHVVQPDMEAGDRELISRKLDFLGLNIYSGFYVEAIAEAPGYRILDFPPHYPFAFGLDWLAIVPPAIFWTPYFLHQTRRPPAFYITENGYSSDSSRTRAQLINDVDRIMILRGNLHNVGRAVRAGVPMRGYFQWSLMDHFEWTKGYAKRFGLHYTDFDTLEIVPKQSARWYRNVIAANAIL